uniref:Neurabin-1 n=2 Tax=Lutzomyia longipalpis TaxID=7200 RepID=A0A1B0CQA5_LUTLO
MCFNIRRFCIKCRGKNPRDGQQEEPQHKPPKGVPSICLNIPGVRSSSISTVSGSTDEGGFNEPSPEIKAPLKPPYDFDLPADLQLPPEPPPSMRDSSSLDSNDSPHELHYVDVGYRLNPDGSEGDDSYRENDYYGGGQGGEGYKVPSRTIPPPLPFPPPMEVEGKVVYATIKPELPPPNELFADSKSNSLEEDVQSPPSGNSTDYHSPQTILDPTRPTLIGGTAEANGCHEDKFTDDPEIFLAQKPLPPPPSPPMSDGPPLDVQDDVKFADASDSDHENMPDAMTADEADKLLSSSFLIILQIISGKNPRDGQQEEPQHKPPKGVPSICLNIPGVRSSSISTVSGSTDEGGFNEPSPEIKAPLKPPYDFDLPADLQLPPEPPPSMRDSSSLDSNDSPHELHYVDVGYRLNPDGSEGDDSYRENDYYGGGQGGEGYKVPSRTIPPPLPFPPPMEVEGKVVYATIKPELPPPNELFADSKSNSLEEDVQSPPSGNSTDYHSPQTILDPTRPTLIGGTAEANGCHEDKFTDDPEIFLAQKPLPPPPSPPMSDGPPLDVQDDVKFADASDSDHENMPDAMTADEADKLLSSREQSILSDEQAKEVEALLSVKSQPPQEVEPPVVVVKSVVAEVPAVNGLNGNHHVEGDPLNDSIVSVESMQSTTEATTATNKVTSSHLDDVSAAGSVISLAEGEADVSADESHDSYVPEYPPVKAKEVYVEAGVHYFEDGNFWMEVPGLLESDDEDDELEYPAYTKRNAKYYWDGCGCRCRAREIGDICENNHRQWCCGRDGRIQVNDQIIEVDGKSLVGVTQAYAASVLRNTSGLVKFSIGRERDPQNSEVAQLIRQSLQADKEKEERIKGKQQQDEKFRRVSEHSDDSTLPASANSSVSEGPMSPTAAMETLFDAEATHSQEVESLKRLLQESQLKYFSIERELLVSREKAKEVEALLSVKSQPPQEVEPPVVVVKSVVAEVPAVNGLNGNHHVEGDPLNDSIVSVESMQSTTEATTATNKVTSSHLDDVSAAGSVISLAEGEADVSADESHDSYVPEYPPVKAKEVYVEAGVHYFEDGNFWMEVPGLLESDDEDDELEYPAYTKRNAKDVDPVAASAEYELEKRVEKMDVFPVELMKGPEGLGLSIIGMGVGADAGLEKLGIFVKTITDNGAAARDGRIQVNDQIIEVDGKSLVGVTQAYAASVLRNTSGLVKFSIGRERDPQNSEVAQLIRQSLQADKEKEERIKGKQQQDEKFRRVSEHSDDSTLPASANSSVSEGPMSPTAAMETLFDAEATHSQEVESLKRLLQELIKLESTGNEAELLNERLRQMEQELVNTKKESTNYQSMLQQSQAQYTVLDKKIMKAKRIVREFKQRELELIHREEFYLQCLQEKDTEYNALVRKLKDRVICLEQELEGTQRKAGFPVFLPYDSASLKLTPQMSRRQPPKPLFPKLDTELSDTEISDVSIEGEGEKTATVERKLPLKDELDTAIPQHELLDNSANKCESGLGERTANKSYLHALNSSCDLPWGLSKRQLPSGKKSLSSSSSDCALDETTDEEERTQSTSVSQSDASPMVHEVTPEVSHYAATNLIYQEIPAAVPPPPPVSLSPSPPTTSSTPTTVLTPNMAAPAITETINVGSSPLYAQVQKDRSNSAATHTTIPSSFKTGQQSLVTTFVSPASHTSELSSSYDSILGGSSDKLSDSGNASDSWMYLIRRKGLRPPSSFTEQLNQVLTKRERCLSLSNLLIRENCGMKNIFPKTLSPPGSVPWQQQQGPPSPSSISSTGSTSPGGYSPNRTLDLSGSSGSFSSELKGKGSHNWQNGPVCQWLMALGLEHHTEKFIECGVEGGALLQLDSRDFKILGVVGDDKSKLKRHLKVLKNMIEKERKQQEKTRKQHEKQLRKAEKEAAAANKKK